MKVDLLNLSNWRRYYILSWCFFGGDIKVDYKMTKNGGDMKVEWRKFKVEEIWRDPLIWAIELNKGSLLTNTKITNHCSLFRQWSLPSPVQRTSFIIFWGHSHRNKMRNHCNEGYPDLHCILQISKIYLKIIGSYLVEYINCTTYHMYSMAPCHVMWASRGLSSYLCQ